jgi:D-glycero-D-manno-heptose 1,7-bisphosphate phosphatase
VKARPAVFLDRDGTIIRDEHYLSDPARVTLLDGAPAAIARLRAAGCAVVVVTNQSGIARGQFTTLQYEAVRTRLDQLLADAGAPVDGTYMCPHHPKFGDPCDCRKPGLALYRQAIADLHLDASRTAFVGDRWSDIGAADAFHGLGILVPSIDTPAADLARAQQLGVAMHSLGEAADRILATLVP